MWPFRSKKSDADLAIEAMPRAIEIAAQKWIEFEAQSFAQSMDLKQKVALFSQGIEKGFREWEAFKRSPTTIFFLIAIKGIERSRTYLRLELEAVLDVPIPGPHERTDDEEWEELKLRLVDRAARKWEIFSTTLFFKEGVSLRTKIDFFKVPFVEGLRIDFPFFRDATNDEFDAMIALGIDRTGTHSIVEVFEAMGLDTGQL